MSTRIATTFLALVLVFALIGCAATEAPAPAPVDGTPPAGGDPALGSRLAPGLYDLEGGVVQALGTLEYVDIEGGFWAIIGGTEADGNFGETAAVISNGDELESTLRPLEGRTVLATGTRFDGASIRMAGPEIVVTEIVEISDTPGAAE
jgi:hypothetical protein